MDFGRITEMWVQFLINYKVAAGRKRNSFTRKQKSSERIGSLLNDRQIFAAIDQ